MHTTEVICFQIGSGGGKEAGLRSQEIGGRGRSRTQERAKTQDSGETLSERGRNNQQHSETTKQRTICDNGSEWRNAYQKASSLEKIDLMSKDDDEHRIVTTRVSSNSKPDFRESKSLMVGV